MALIVKQLKRSKTGKTLQTCVMNSWNARRALVNNIEAKERKLSVLVTGNSISPAALEHVWV